MSDLRFQIIREPTSAPGDFYVDSNCCITCGVPQAVAPDLVGWSDSGVCRWIKQPSDPSEFQRAFAVFDGQDVGCHRYAGTDPEIQRRVGFENCDFPPHGTMACGVNSSSDGPFRRRPPAIWSKKWRRKH